MELLNELLKVCAEAAKSARAGTRDGERVFEEIEREGLKPNNETVAHPPRPNLNRCDSIFLLIFHFCPTPSPWPGRALCNAPSDSHTRLVAV